MYMYMYNQLTKHDNVDVAFIFSELIFQTSSVLSYVITRSDGNIQQRVLLPILHLQLQNNKSKKYMDLARGRNDVTSHSRGSIR